MLAAEPTLDDRLHSIFMTVQDFHYSNSDAAPPPSSLILSSTSDDRLAHEVWLGHLGPLPLRVTSAGPNLSDVTASLPALAELLDTSREFGQPPAIENEETEPDGARAMRLPLLFVRVSDGLAFLSGRFLQGHQASPSSSWTLQLI